MDRIAPKDFQRLLYVRADVFKAEADLMQARHEQQEFYKDLAKRYKVTDDVSLNVDTGEITRPAATNEVAAEAAKPVEGVVVQ